MNLGDDAQNLCPTQYNDIVQVGEVANKLNIEDLSVNSQIAT